MILTTKTRLSQILGPPNSKAKWETRIKGHDVTVSVSEPGNHRTIGFNEDRHVQCQIVTFRFERCCVFLYIKRETQGQLLETYLSRLNESTLHEVVEIRNDLMEKRDRAVQKALNAAEKTMPLTSWGTYPKSQIAYPCFLESGDIYMKYEEPPILGKPEPLKVIISSDMDNTSIRVSCDLKNDIYEADVDQKRKFSSGPGENELEEMFTQIKEYLLEKANELIHKVGDPL